MYGVILSLISILAAAPQEYDVVVYGATPGGISTAITAARLGRTVALVEYHPHVGGMSASGLGKTDIITPGAIGGLFKEFVARVKDHYVKKYGADHKNVRLCREGYFYEPSVAEAIFGEMMAEQPRITVLTNHQLEAAVMNKENGGDGNKVKAIDIVDRASGEKKRLTGKVFVDATYEGDLAAKSGAKYRLGRESRHEYNELHAGTIYQNHETKVILSGTTGEGDDRLQAYTFRLCLTTDPENSVPLTSPPPGYDRTRYLGYVEDFKEGRLPTVYRCFSIAPIPNNKTDVNMNPRPLGFVFAEENRGYPEADWQEREKITEKIRNLTLGLLYFVQNDPAVPEKQRKEISKYNLAKDEFQDNNHFPWQLYVREARRIEGEYTLSENDVIIGPKLGRPRVHADAITAGEFPIDSFPARKKEPGHKHVLEGYLCMLKAWTHPYQIPFGVIVPKKIDGLLAPVPASTTHVAFATVRLEPTWMALGQAAGTAAHMAIENNSEVRDVDINELQRRLLAQGQVLTYFNDINPKDPTYAALQYYGTKGFFSGYRGNANKPITAAEANEWFAKLTGGKEPSPPADEKSQQAPLSRREFTDWLIAAKISPPEFVGDQNAAVTRGEFLKTFYDAHVTPPAAEKKE